MKTEEDSRETSSLERMELLALALLLFVAVKAEEVRRLMLCAASSLETISSNFTMRALSLISPIEKLLPLKLEFPHFLS